MQVLFFFIFFQACFLFLKSVRETKSRINFPNYTYQATTFILYRQIFHLYNLVQENGIVSAFQFFYKI